MPQGFRCRRPRAQLVTPEVRAPFGSWSFPFLPPAWRAVQARLGSLAAPVHHPTVIEPSSKAPSFPCRTPPHARRQHKGAIMQLASQRAAQAAALVFLLMPGGVSADERSQHALQNLKHVIVVMQENHSFDNYFGVLAYAPGGVYHPVQADRDDDHDRHGKREDDEHARSTGCHPDDHRCVDGLTCQVLGNGTLSCANANVDSEGRRIFAFHNTNRCVNPDLDHGWFGTHREANFNNPNASLRRFLGDGFVQQNEPDDGSPSRNETMGYYTQAE